MEHDRRVGGPAGYVELEKLQGVVSPGWTPTGRGDTRDLINSECHAHTLTDLPVVSGVLSAPVPTKTCGPITASRPPGDLPDGSGVLSAPCGGDSKGRATEVAPAAAPWTSAPERDTEGDVGRGGKERGSRAASLRLLACAPRGRAERSTTCGNLVSARHGVLECGVGGAVGVSGRLDTPSGVSTDQARQYRLRC